ncbi:glutamate racemase [Limnohabitans sp. G3-2]|uniref:glutamate racemase n=1 Tax=Limnohabitans sp. G3-2 TaxID=1100711 RepID=UPI000C1F4B16|nr:glutamate racemase [Limnohabitans sp. G3-2]PIT74930.1 glutamate racemase [Limnohabitans sp. G3-2]
MNAPIGVFDSGIGGLSVLRALQKELPHERFVYLADNAYAPYGEKSEAFVSQRTHAAAEYLLARHQIKALVVACNTATAAAIQALRLQHPALPVVGLEPALKPALALSHTRRIGVMATRGTVGSEKFARLLSSVQHEAQFEVQACNGLALAIEQSTLPDQAEAAHAQIAHLVQTYTQAMGPFGSAPGEIDTLVLGCTHYVFVEQVLQQLLGPHVQLVSTGEPVARQTHRLLAAAERLNTEVAQESEQPMRLLTTGNLQGLQAAAQRWLNGTSEICQAVPASLALA